MTITETTPSLPFAADDPRGVFLRAWAVATEVASAVTPEDAGRPSPCDEFDAATVRAHLLSVGHRVSALGRGDDPFAVGEGVEEVPGDDWAAAFAAAGEDVTAAWADDSLLARTITLPWAEAPGAGILAMYVSEIVVHTWDLARATGQSPTWDDDVVETGFAALQIGLPDEGRIEAFEAARANMPEGAEDFTYPFAAALPVAEDAAPIDRLVAWSGRDPHWSA
jgi:uncharacterized protein (TIGR03086 family)